MAQGVNDMPWTSEQPPCADAIKESQEKVKKSRVSGSRRIFSPHFKIQVLDSYRQDLDCRGNQRATARKYNIHRRQIQKWLQCEQHLRACVSEDVKSACVVPNSVVKLSSDGNVTNYKKDFVETDSALNRSAEMYCRLPDAASRTGGEDRNRQTQVEDPRTKVFNDKTSSNMGVNAKLEAHTLKLVAQKLYPRSPSTRCENVEKILTSTSLVYGPKLLDDSNVFTSGTETKLVSDFIQSTPYIPTKISYSKKTENEVILDKNFNELYPTVNVNSKSVPTDLVPLNLENKIEVTVPKDDLTKEAFSDVFDKNSLNFEQGLLKENYGPDNLISVNNNDKIRKNCCALSEESVEQELRPDRLMTQSCCMTNEGQEFITACNTNYTVEIFKENAVRTPEETCNLPVVPISSSPLNCEVNVPSVIDSSTTLSRNVDSNFSDSVKNINSESECLEKNKVGVLKDIISPKRKWIQASLQDSELSETPTKIQKRDKSLVLPIKQQIKLDMRSKMSPSETKKPEYTDSVLKSTDKHISQNFTIEHLCSPSRKDSIVKPEATFTPTSFKSPTYSISPHQEYFGYSFENYYTYPYQTLDQQSYVSRIPPPHNLGPVHFKPEIIQTESPNYIYYNPQQNFTTQCDVKLKEEKLSDSEENTDVDITSITPVDNHTFDFHCATGKRRSFSVQFKLSVLDAFYNDKDCNRNQRATARKYNINRRQVQKWLSQENELRNEGSVKNGKYLQRQRLGNENKDSFTDQNKILGECKQCPQHCVIKNQKSESGLTENFSPFKKLDENDNTNLDETVCCKKIKDAICLSTKDVCQITNTSEYLCSLEKSNLYENCGLTDRYHYPSFHNLNVHFYPYNSVCDWSNVQSFSSATVPQYPCLFPLCRPSIGRV